MPSYAKTLVALLLVTSAVALPTPQIAGEGAASDSILTGLDNASGYATEDALDNLGANVATVKGGTAATPATGGGSPPPPPPPPPRRRQLNKISAGLQTFSSDAGTGAETTGLTNALNNIDGTTTDAAANAGQQVGNNEESILEGAGSSVPKA
ncbi:hypothetical protein ACEQ8H_003679 [Pleosporales sp. CAS-2024a]